MRLSNATIYRVALNGDFAALLAGLEPKGFAPCGATQEDSIGFIPPRGLNEAMAESIGGWWVLSVFSEAKRIPASEMRKKLDERCAEIERETGRQPGKKERKQLKEDITQELLPLAFAKNVRVNVLIEPHAGLMVLDSASQGRVDAAVTQLVSAADLAVSAVHTHVEPASAMAGWLGTQQPPEGFDIDRECELKATDDSKAVVRYAKHALDIDEVQQHIAKGKRPTRLALTWQDRVSFVLTEGMVLRKLQFLEGVFDGGDKEKEADGFDADVAIVTGEMGQLVPELIAAMGGEVQMSKEPQQ